MTRKQYGQYFWICIGIGALLSLSHISVLQIVGGAVEVFGWISGIGWIVAVVRDKRKTTSDRSM